MKSFKISKLAFVAAYFCMGNAIAQTQILPEPKPSNTLLDCEKKQEFQLLFDGTLSSFQDKFANWVSGNTTNTNLDSRYVLSAADSAISTTTATADIRSRVKYGDFDWRLSYRNNGNQGIFYKSAERGCCEYSTGVEYAIDDGETSSKVASGAAYDLFTPTKNVYQKFNTGKWNAVRIVAKGDSIEHWLNNEKIVGYRYWNARWNSAFSGSKWAGYVTFAQNTDGCKCHIPSGWIGFQGDHGGNWKIRNMRITTNPTFVKPGPAACQDVSSIKENAPTQYAVERVNFGVLRVNLGDRAVIKAEVVSMDGKFAAESKLENNGKSVLIRNWKASGVYMLRVETRSGAIGTRKLML